MIVSRYRVLFVGAVATFACVPLLTSSADPSPAAIKWDLSDLWPMLRDQPEDFKLAEIEYERDKLELRKLAKRLIAKDDIEPVDARKLLPFLLSPDFRLRCRVMGLLNKISEPHVEEFEEFVIPLIGDPNEAVRSHALRLLLQKGSNETRVLLSTFDKSRNPHFREIVAEVVREQNRRQGKERK